MIDYNIVMLNNRQITMVNGEVCQWDDYNYADPDYKRQQAMSKCEDILLAQDSFNREPDKFNFGRGETCLSMGDVARHLFTKNPQWHFLMPHTKPAPLVMTEDELMEVNVDTGHMILLINKLEPDEF